MKAHRRFLLTSLGAMSLGFIVLAAEWGPVKAAGPRKPRNADCAFLRDPDGYLGSAGRRLRDASQVTDEISAQVRGGQDLASYEEVPYRNFIDQFVFDKMRRDRVPHAGLVDDATFLRRVTLDLTGRTPTPTEVRSFVADSSADKREQAVDKLIESPEFVDRWTLFYGDLFKNTDNNNNVNRYYEGRNTFYRWLRQTLADRWPYDAIAINILTANGSNFEFGAANWMAGGVTPGGPIQDAYDTLTVQATQEFLGMAQMDCLLCHNGAGHLNQLSLWASKTTRMQAWQMSAYFSRITLARQPGQGDQPYIVSERTAGSYDLGSNFGNRPNRTITDNVRTVTPKYILNNAAGANYRQSLAEAITSDPQFARASVNYLWAELMGLGLVDPPDQFDPARLDPNNPPPAPWTLQPSNPELLQALATDFSNGGFDLRRTIRLIVTSSAYQLSSRFPGKWKPDYVPYFARHIVKRLKAEEVHDALLRATGTTASYTLRGFDTPVAWAMQMPDVREPGGTGSNFLNTFLRGNRDNLPRSDEVTIQQELALMNDTFVINRIRSTAPTSMIRTMLTAGGRTDPQMVDELFLTALSRMPTPQEKDTALKTLAGRVTTDQRATAYEDLLWALINKVDFLYNY